MKDNSFRYLGKYYDLQISGKIVYGCRSKKRSANESTTTAPCGNVLELPNSCGDCADYPCEILPNAKVVICRRQAKTGIALNNQEYEDYRWLMTTDAP